jgi:signal transduction histidine kinase
VKIAFYYVAQEALNNVSKHARASHVDVNFQCDGDAALLVVHDDGQGFDISRVTPEHLGLAIMHERTESIGGDLTVVSEPGSGATVALRWRNPEAMGST